MSRNAHAKSGVGPTMDLVPTPLGTAGVTWYPALGSVRAVALLGHATMDLITDATSMWIERQLSDRATGTLPAGTGPASPPPPR
jgi:hypothetical protein